MPPGDPHAAPRMPLSEDVLFARSGAALFDWSDTAGILRLEGPDHLPFLNSLTSNDVLTLGPSDGNHHALLDKKSRMLAEFWFYREEQYSWILTEREQMAKILELLEAFHFSEDLRFTDASEDFAILALLGPEAPDCLRARSAGAPPVCSIRANSMTWLETHTERVRLVERSLTGDPGFLLWFPRSKRESGRRLFTDPHLESAARPLSPEVLEVLRIEAGVPRFGKEWHGGILLMEAGHDEEMISFTKGCFPGQEVIARTRSRGQLQKRLLGITVAARLDLPFDVALEFRERVVGRIQSGVWSETLQQTCLLAYLNRSLLPDGRERIFRAAGKEFTGVVVRPPFYFPEGRIRKGRADYHAGMQEYHEGRYGEARGFFESGLSHHPYDPALMEALGMTLERMDDVEGAICCNLRFAEMDPASVMAHANLSRLYLRKGWKERAEEEQALAASLGLRQKSGEQLDERHREKLEVARQRDAERRFQLFQEVLALDPDDGIANFGLGRLFLEQDRPEQALPCLRRVLVLDKNQSAVYPLLVRALTRIGAVAEAGEMLKQGLAVCREQGDLMPLKELETLRDV